MSVPLYFFPNQIHLLKTNCNLQNHAESLAAYICNLQNHPEHLTAPFCNLQNHPERLTASFCNLQNRPERLTAPFCNLQPPNSSLKRVHPSECTLLVINFLFPYNPFAFASFHSASISARVISFNERPCFNVCSSK